MVRQPAQQRDPAVNVSAADRIIEALKRDLITGVLEPGTLIIEAQVGARFGVSKTPAREALLRLAEIGLIEVMPGRGYVVTKLSWQQIKDLFELRLHFECTAVELAAQRASPAETADLKRLAIRPRQKALGVEALLDYNLEFHRRI